MLSSTPRRKPRYHCKHCRKTFSETKATNLYRIHKPRWLMIAVVTLLAHGGPFQAIVAAFELDGVASLAGNEGRGHSAGGSTTT
jgi:transposase-like protein